MSQNEQKSTKALRIMQEGSMFRVYWGILPVACSGSERAAQGFIDRHNTKENRAIWSLREEEYKDNLGWVFHILHEEAENNFFKTNIDD